jgi:hypothetical protein
MGNYARQNMQLVGLVQFTGPHTVQTVLGPDAAGTPLVSPYFLEVYRRAVPIDEIKTDLGGQ